MINNAKFQFPRSNSFQALSGQGKEIDFLSKPVLEEASYFGVEINIK